MDLRGKSSRFADFENIVDRGSAVIFHVDSGLCLSYVRTLGPKWNLDHRSFFRLDRYVNEFIQIISFVKKSSFKLMYEPLLLELYCVPAIKHVGFFTIWAKLTVAFTCTSLPFTLTLLFSDLVVVSDLNKTFGRSMDLMKKRHGSVDLHTPINPPLCSCSHSHCGRESPWGGRKFQRNP